MKKYLFFLGMAGLSLFASCSSADDVVESGLSAEEINRLIVQAGMDSDVPISLSAGSGQGVSSVTRSPMESDVNGNFTTPDAYMGVFLLAQKPQSTPTTPGPLAEDQIVWNTSTYSAKMWNHPAKAVERTTWNEQNVNAYTYVTFYDPATLSGTPATKVYYYPYGNWYNYYFYTYYPRVADNLVTKDPNSNVVTVPYTLTGREDILCGTATPPTTKMDEGFCAKYYREIRNANEQLVPFDALPGMQLKHTLAQLRFWVKSDKAPTKTFKIASLKLVDVPTQWTLTVADKSDISKSGTMTSASETTASMNVSEMTVDNDGVTPLTVSDDSKLDVTDDQSWLPLTITEQLVGYLMIPTTDMITTANTALSRDFPVKPRVQLQYYYDDELSLELESPVEIALPTTSHKFEAGKVYNIILTIPVPEGLDATAQTDPWVVVDPSANNEQNIHVTAE